jgi:signal transduction histidine kinase
MSPILIACRPILKSNDQGPVAGWLMMGQILTKAFARKLSERTQVTQTYDPIRGGVPAAHPRELMGRITAEHPIAFDAVSDTLLKAYAVFPDISGHPALLVQADINRSIWSRAESALWFIMISTATVGALLLVGILVLLNRVVSRPVADLTQRVISFGENQVFHPCPLSGRRDEVGTLYREFERMATQLSSVHQGLWDSNRLLAHEIQERRLFSERLSLNQERLRALSSELVMSEDRERRRIATELHDGIGQDLAMLHLQVELLLQQGNGTPNTVTEKLEAIRGAIEKIIHDSRSLTFEISPPVLYELGLGPAIEWLAEEISERHGIQVDVLDYASVHLDDSMRALIFRSVRELLYNVVKHARASRVRVTLEQEDENLNIGVEDDGLGFSMEDGAGRAATGLGLFSIQERFIQLGGKIDIGSGEKTGARVTLYLPLGITSNANTEAC